MDQLLNITIGDMLHQNAVNFPQNDCIINLGHDVRWSWKEFDELTDVVARGMIAMGIKKGDHVAIWATNVPQWILVQFATAKIGAVMVTVNTNYKQFELEYLLRQSDTSVLFLFAGFKDSNYVDHVRALCPELETNEGEELSIAKLPCLKQIFFISDDGIAPKGMHHFDELYTAANNVPQKTLTDIMSQLDPKDVINMQYTSGTTGFPKGVMLTHYNIVNNGMCIGDCMKLTSNDRLCIPVPLFHCFGCVLGVMACLTHASTMVLVDSFNPLRVLDTIQKERCTAVHGVPTMFIAMLENAEFKNYDTTTLRTGIMAGSPCPIKTMQQCMTQMNMSEITIAYGQTESSPVFTMTRTDDPIERRVSTVGKLMPHCEGKIIDVETGKECPYGVPGEIVTRGYHLMKGYYKMVEATKTAIDCEGWLHTGDIGTVDEAGYFKITGRLKDMIIRGGENIYPREIEEFLYTHKAVKDVQVIGVPDIKYGEEVLAYVILRQGETATEEEIIKFVKEGLSRFKSPRYVSFIDEFPMTASGKIQKYKLRDRAVIELKLEAAAAIETA